MSSPSLKDLKLAIDAAQNAINDARNSGNAELANSKNAERNDLMTQYRSLLRESTNEDVIQYRASTRALREEERKKILAAEVAAEAEKDWARLVRRAFREQEAYYTDTLDDRSGPPAPAALAYHAQSNSATNFNRV